MTRPRQQVPVPVIVTRIAAGRPVSAVWLNEIGGTTFLLGAGEEYVKVSARRLLPSARGRVAVGGRIDSSRTVI